MRAIGIDIGGSKTSLGLVDTETGRIGGRIELPTPPPGEADQRFLGELAETVATLPVSGRLPVGVGICELVETGGRIVSAHRVDLTSEALHAALDFAGPVLIEADVRAAALAEAVHGAGRGLSHWIYANAGTGIATVLMQGSTPYHGAHGRALAVGMSPAAFHPGDLAGLTVEDVAGGAGMLRRARSLGIHAERMQDLIAAAATGRAAAREVLDAGGAVLGRALGFLANALDPEAIVVGGGVAAGDMGYLRACEAALRETVWHPDPTSPRLVAAGLGADSGLIGAALAAVAARPAVMPA